MVGLSTPIFFVPQKDFRFYPLRGLWCRIWHLASFGSMFMSIAIIYVLIYGCNNYVLNRLFWGLGGCFVRMLTSVLGIRGMC
jgi:hypothetical protein